MSIRATLKALVINEIIRPRDLPKLTGLSRTTIWRLEKNGEFVQKIRLTKHSIGSRRADIERWIEDRVE
jgi:predicted DNA-binding transcriptional regulator AlpA